MKRALSILLLGLFLLAAPRATASVKQVATQAMEAAQAYYSGRGVAQNMVMAAQLFKAAAETGNPEAQYMYGLLLYRGEGLIKDNGLAAQFYTLAAQQGFAKAQYNLAVLYYKGEGVERDDVQAYKWLLLAARQNEPRALEMMPVALRNMPAQQKETAEAMAAAVVNSRLM